MPGQPQTVASMERCYITGYAGFLPSEQSVTRLTETKVLIAKGLCHPLVGRVVGHLFRDGIPFRGCRIDTNSPLVTPEIKAMLFWRLYESGELRFISRYLRADLDVVELGASLGVVGSFIGRRLDAGRRLVCVEAHPHLVPIVERNVRNNASPGVRVTIVHGAVDYGQGSVDVEFVLAESTLGSRAGEGDGHRVKVPRVRLGELLDREQLSGEYALVCDIEGAERGVFEHETKALARCRQLIIELHDVRVGDRQVTVDGLLQLARERHGFRLRDRHGPVVVLER